MSRRLPASILLTVFVAASLPTMTTAQEDTDTLEGVEWHLIGYAVRGEVGIAPWAVDATLLLEDGAASGSTGCKDFSGGYTLDGEGLAFDELLATRAACDEEAGAVEGGYLANLPLVASWSIDDGVLSLADAAGAPLLDFEQTVIELTPSDVDIIASRFADLQSQVERLDERLDSVRIGLLRERIRTLEEQVKALQAATASGGGADGASFSRGESTLLQGIPPNVRRTCVPLRGGSLPNGTLAAVRCEPGAGVVAEMAYYLMPYAAAERTFRRVMRDNGVPRRFECSFGRPSQVLQAPYNATGCFVDGSDQANVRLVTWAADCHELDVAGRRVSEPAVYIALESTRRRIQPLYDWATNPDEFALAPVWIDIPHGGTPRSPGCRGLAP